MSFGQWYNDRIARAYGWKTFPKQVPARNHVRHLNSQAQPDNLTPYILMAREVFDLGGRYFFATQRKEFQELYKIMPATISTFYEVIKRDEPCRLEFKKIL